MLISGSLDIPGLKEIATSKYETLLSSLWATQSFSMGVGLLYRNTQQNDRLLREVVVNYIGKNIDKLMERDDFIEIMKEHGELATDVLKLVLKGKSEEGEKDFEDYVEGVNLTKKEMKKSKKYNWI